MSRPPPRSTLFPYTTLSRSEATTIGQGLVRLRKPLLDGYGAPHGIHRARELGQNTVDRKSTRLNSSHANISYAVFCLKTRATRVSPPLRATFRSPYPPPVTL